MCSSINFDCTVGSSTGLMDFALDLDEAPAIDDGAPEVQRRKRRATPTTVAQLKRSRTKTGSQDANASRRFNSFSRARTAAGMVLSYMHSVVGSATTYVKHAFTPHFVLGRVDCHLKGQNRSSLQRTSMLMVAWVWMVSQLKAITSRINALRERPRSAGSPAVGVVAMAVGFDETYQPATDMKHKSSSTGHLSKARRRKKKLRQRSLRQDRQKEVTDSTLQHSMIITAQLGIDDGLPPRLVDGSRIGAEDIPNDRPAPKEEVSLPPIKVATTDNNHLGVALLSTMERWIFDMPVRSWISRLANVAMILFFFFVSDAASANIKVLWILQVFFQCGFTGVLILWWWEPCALHQVSRAGTGILGFTGVDTAAHSLSKILKMKSKSKQFQAAAMEALEDLLEWEQFNAPSVKFATSEVFWKALFELLLARWCDDNGKMVEEHTDSDNDNDKAAMLDLFEFFKGSDVTGHHLCHYCCGRGCHTSRESVVQDAKKVVHNAFFASMTGIKGFSAARWLKLLPGLRDLARWQSFARLGKGAFNKLHLPKQEAAASPDDDTALRVDPDAGMDAIRRMIGVRLAKGKRFFNQDVNTFSLLLSLFVFWTLEKFVSALFLCSNQSFYKARGTTSRLVHLKLKEIKAHLWDTVINPEANPHLLVVMAFWPSGMEPEKMHEQIQLTLLLVIGHLIMRYRAWEEFPCAFSELERFGEEENRDFAVVVDRLYEDAMRKNTCCLERGCMRPLRSALDGVGPASGKGLFLYAARRFNFYRVLTTLQEERHHTRQHRFGQVSQNQSPKSWAQQSASKILDVVKMAWHAAGQRCLDHAPEVVRNAYKHALRTEARDKKRKHDGNPVFTYWAAMLTPEEKARPNDEDVVQRKSDLAAQFKLLGKEGQREWLEKQQVNILLNTLKEEEAATSILGPSGSAAPQSPPWGLSDADNIWPLDPDFIDKELHKFKKKDDGLRLLHEAMVDASKIDAMDDHRKYRPRRALMALARSSFDSEIAEPMVSAHSSWQEAKAMSTTAGAKAFMRPACWQLHCGYCDKDDEETKADLEHGASILFSITRTRLPKEQRLNAQFVFECQLPNKETIRCFARQCSGLLTKGNQLLALQRPDTNSAASSRDANPDDKFIFTQAEAPMPLTLRYATKPLPPYGVEPLMCTPWQIVKILQTAQPVRSWSIRTLKCKGFAKGTVVAYEEDLTFGSFGRLNDPVRKAQGEACWLDGYHAEWAESMSGVKRRQTQKSASGAESDDDDVESAVDSSDAQEEQFMRLLNKYFGKGLRPDDSSEDEGEDFEHAAGGHGGHAEQPGQGAPPAPEPLDPDPPGPAAAGGLHGVHQQATDKEMLLRVLGPSRYPLPRGWAMYYNRQSQSWKGFRGGKGVNGTHCTLSRHGNHQAAIRHCFETLQRVMDAAGTHIPPL